jgi:MIP family channel proteins
MADVARRIPIVVGVTHYGDLSAAEVARATGLGEAISVEKSFQLNALDRWPIAAVKAQIQDEVGYPVEQTLTSGGIPTSLLRQTLCFNGQIMHDDCFLSDYGVGPNSTIYLTWAKDRAPWQHVICSSLAEFLGTFVITFVACSAAIQHRELLPVATAYGLSVMVMMFCTVDLSGGHLNPALSLALFFTRIQGITRTICYIIAQMGGATCAVLLLKRVTPESMHFMEQSMKSYHGPLGATTLGIDVLPMQAFYLEATMSFLISIVYFLTYIDPPVTGMERILLAPLPVGFSVTVAMLATGNISGGCFNPARAFGPAVVMSFWVDLWPYLLGPILGSVLAGLFHRFVWLPRHEMMWDAHVVEGEEEMRDVRQ